MWWDQLSMLNLGGTFGLGFHLANAFLSFFFLLLSLFVNIPLHVHINTNSSQMLSLYVIFSSSSFYWGKLYIGSDDIVRSILFFSLLYLSHIHTHIHRRRYLHNILLVVWMKMMMMMMMLETIIFYSEMLCAMLIASFLCRIWNKSIEIDREREREKKETRKTTVLFLYSFRNRRTFSDW
jgi:hypothetical protein